MSLFTYFRSVHTGLMTEDLNKQVMNHGKWKTWHCLVTWLNSTFSGSWPWMPLVFPKKVTTWKGTIALESETFVHCSVNIPLSVRFLLNALAKVLDSSTTVQYVLYNLVFDAEYYSSFSHMLQSNVNKMCLWDNLVLLSFICFAFVNGQIVQ